MLHTLAHAGHNHAEEAVSTLNNTGTALVVAAGAVVLVAVIVGLNSYSSRRKAKDAAVAIEYDKSDHTVS